MKRPKFAHKAPDPDAAEPFDTAEEASMVRQITPSPSSRQCAGLTGFQPNSVSRSPNPASATCTHTGLFAAAMPPILLREHLGNYMRGGADSSVLGRTRPFDMLRIASGATQGEERLPGTEPLTNSPHPEQLKGPYRGAAVSGRKYGGRNGSGRQYCRGGFETLPYCPAC